MGCNFLLQGGLPEPGIKPGSPALQVDSLPALQVDSLQMRESIIHIKEAEIVGLSGSHSVVSNSLRPRGL